MKRFAELIDQLDSSTSTKKRIEALSAYLSEVDDQDRLWTIALLSHRRPKRIVRTTDLREWCAEMTGIPVWLLEESYHIVGDLAETIALLLPDREFESNEALNVYVRKMVELKDASETYKKNFIQTSWKGLGQTERFAFNKLITGGFRIGISQKNMSKALASITGLDENEVAFRLMGDWTPLNTTYKELIESPIDADHSKPFPFYLAYPIESDPSELGSADEWIIERKWDGIRGQIIRRNGETFVWSRGEELMTDRFPELVEMAGNLPDGTVLDGEIVAHDDNGILPFQILQKRIGRKKVGKKLLTDAPVRFISYDILEVNGEDSRLLTMEERRNLLESVLNDVSDHRLMLSPVLELNFWNEAVRERENSRSHFAEGLMLKKKEGTYKVGRKKGEWWKWKVDPLTIDAVLVYAMRGHGRRANLYTDYTFAVWDDEELVPFTKAYSGLTDDEFRQVDHFVKRNTIERFGPVRSVTPKLVFEIAFEGIAKSNRHKSGISLRFPRMHRWRKEKPVREANTLKDLRDLLDIYGNG